MAIPGIFTRLWQNFDSLFLIWQNVEPTFKNWYIIGLIFIAAKGQILKNNLTIWSHWVCLKIGIESFDGIWIEW